MNIGFVLIYSVQSQWRFYNAHNCRKSSKFWNKFLKRMKKKKLKPAMAPNHTHRIVHISDMFYIKFWMSSVNILQNFNDQKCKMSLTPSSKIMTYLHNLVGVVTSGKARIIPVGAPGLALSWGGGGGGVLLCPFLYIKNDFFWGGEADLWCDREFFFFGGARGRRGAPYLRPCSWKEINSL